MLLSFVVFVAVAVFVVVIEVAVDAVLILTTIGKLGSALVRADSIR